MKILIVDDEIFTRQGIIEQISWAELGVDDIQQAFDGINALDIADSFIPDILLTDVRMPRMDGIELSFKLREIHSTCEIIFMSGYSDKEYLKSAIKLKAISYVEKPIDLEELQNAIKSAVLSKSKAAKLNKSLKINIAEELIKKNTNLDIIKGFFHEDQFNFLSRTEFISLIISIKNDLNADKSNLLSDVENLISKSGLSAFSFFKSDEQIVFHLYSSDKQNHCFRKDQINLLCVEISQYFSQYGKFFICIGKKVNGIQNVLNSYEFALEALSITFFYNYNSTVYKDVTNTKIYKYDENVISEFVKYLSLEDKHRSIMLIKRLTSEIKTFTNTPVNYIKDVYYRLFIQLIKFSSEIKIELSNSSLENKSLFENFISFSSIFELEDHIIEKIEELFKLLEEKSKNIDPITNILRFIHENYMDINLSLPQISENTYLSPTYICKIFKDQTGTTINKYISEYRLNKSKELLKDKNITINDISAKVGYGDGNYFTKIFKKETGLTPSEYRKKYLL